MSRIAYVARQIHFSLSILPQFSKLGALDFFTIKDCS